MAQLNPVSMLSKSAITKHPSLLSRMWLHRSSGQRFVKGGSKPGVLPAAVIDEEIGSHGIIFILAFPP